MQTLTGTNMYELKILDGITYIVSYIANGPEDYDVIYEPLC
jgi:hypothetical protein